MSETPIAETVATEEKKVETTQTNTLDLGIQDYNKAIDDVISKLQGNDFTIYMYCPAMNRPSGGVGFMFKMARILKDAGYGIKMIYEPRVDQQKSYEKSVKDKKEVMVYEKFQPTWLDFSISDIEFLALGDKELLLTDGTTIKCSALNPNPSDFIIIPEGFPNIMEKLANVYCKKIVLAQSFTYITPAMKPGQKWAHFGITDAISVSNAITQYVSAVFPETKIKNVKQSISRKYFKAPEKMSSKFPMVVYTQGRGAESGLKLANIIKNFNLFYPHLRFVRFVELSGMDREKFGEMISQAALALSVDDIAGFGTFPLECMACGTHVVAYATQGMSEYVNQENGFWAANGDLFQPSELLGIGIEKWIKGEMDTPLIQEEYEKTLAPYTEEKEKDRLMEIMKEYKEERIEELTKMKK